MSASKVPALSKLFRLHRKTHPPAAAAAAAAAATTSAATTTATSASSSSSSLTLASDEDETLKNYVTAIDISASGSKKREFVRADDPSRLICGQISSILRDDSPTSDPQERDDESSMKNVLSLEIPWFPDTTNNKTAVLRKEVCRERKSRFLYVSTQGARFRKITEACAQKLGAEATMEVFDKIGRENGLKEYNALIGICLENARATNNVEVALERIGKAFELFKSMKEQGFPVEEATYGPLLLYLIDMNMVEEFQIFSQIIIKENPGSIPIIGYYEMLLWIGVGNEEKILELCSSIGTDVGGDTLSLQESYFLALCERGRKDDLIRLLEFVDFTIFSSFDNMIRVFQSLGRMSLESFADKFLSVVKKSDYEVEKLSDLIFSYASSIPNLAAEDVILKFKNFHVELDITPPITSYEKLIKYICDIPKVHVALDMVDQLCDEGLPISIDMLESILHASQRSYDFNLVRRINSLICQHNLKPTSEIFSIMINSCIKMKDFDGAYSMLNDLKKMNLTPTSNMYNAIMLGYFREKNIKAAYHVLKQMQYDDVKPDSHTFSYLINNCGSEEDINMLYKELKCAGVQLTKYIFMSLINAYAACGQFEKAKQVIQTERIPGKSINEIKSVLVQALASSGQMSDALSIYKQHKEAGFVLEPKATITLIEYFEGELNMLLQLLEELNNHEIWVCGCYRVIIYCVRHKYLSSTLNLLEKLKLRFCDDEIAMEVIFDEVFALIAEIEPTDVEFGMELLRFIKEELGLSPSRKSLDFLLSACVNAKDLSNSLVIWKEYNTAGLPYNVLTLLRMYQALLACGEWNKANTLLPKIPKQDPHVRYIIEECKTTYKQESGKRSEIVSIAATEVKKKKKKKKTAKKKKQT